MQYNIWCIHTIYMYMYNVHGIYTLSDIYLHILCVHTYHGCKYIMQYNVHGVYTLYDILTHMCVHTYHGYEYIDTPYVDIYHGCENILCICIYTCISKGASTYARSITSNQRYRSLANSSAKCGCVAIAVACLQKSFRPVAIPVACLCLLVYVCKPRTQNHATSHTHLWAIGGS